MNSPVIPPLLPGKKNAAFRIFILGVLLAMGLILLSVWLPPRLASSLGIVQEKLEWIIHALLILIFGFLCYPLLRYWERLYDHGLQQGQENLLRQFFSLPQVGMAIVALDQQHIVWSNAYLTHLLEQEELSRLNWLEICHPDDRPVCIAAMQKLQEDKALRLPLQIRLQPHDEKTFTVRMDLSCQYDHKGNAVHFLLIFEDISEQRRQEEELKTQTRLYQVISHINQSIIRLGDQEHLLQDACNIAVCDGGFHMAWIGLLQADGHLEINAFAGESGSYLDGLSISVNDLDNKGPSATCLREMRHIVCNDIAQDACMLPWREKALQHGFSASASFPFIVDGRVWGCMTLYSGQPGFFDTSELELLDEMAADISFAMAIFETHQREQRNQAALQESQTKLTLATEAANIGLWDLNLESGTSWVSDTYFSMLGFAPRNQSSLPEWLDAMHPEDRETCQTSMQLQLENSQQRIGVQYRTRHRDGSWRWIAGIGQVATRNDEGKPTRLIGINMDITQRLETEFQRTRDTERATGLLKLATAEAGLSEIDLLHYGLNLAEKLTESKIAFLHFINSDQQSIELVAWSTATLKHCNAIFNKHYPISQAGIWADCIKLRKAIICNDYANSPSRRGLPEGHFPLIRFVSIPLIENDHIPLIIGIGNRETDYNEHDIETVQLLANDLWRIIRRRRAESSLVETLDQQLKLNARLEEAHNQLLQSEKLAAIGQLAAGVAHELNNPIGFVHSNLGTLESYVNDLMSIVEQCLVLLPQNTVAQTSSLASLLEKTDYYYIRADLPQLISESKEGLDRVKRIVQDLKDFSRAGELNWEWADLHKGLDSTLNIIWNELKYKCTVHKDYGEIPEVYCLSSQLNQVFMNLLVNASHAIEKRGDITIRTRSENDQVRISISDSGHGIAPEIITRIFEPFFTTKPVGQGTGLGLSLSYSIIQRHRGNLTVESEVGKGTTFHILLPIKPEPAVTEAAS